MNAGFQVSAWLASAALLAACGRPARAEPAMNLRPASVRAQTVQMLSERAAVRRQAARELAAERGWPVRGRTPAGVTFELMALVDGRLCYYATRNVNAAISTAADRVRRTAPFNVSGAGVIAGVWDAGAVRPTHQEFGGRVSVQDGTTEAHYHSTHVGGTMIAAGVNASALGMAPTATVHSYDWTDDLSETAGRAATASNQTSTLYVANYSYGQLTGWDYGAWSGTNGYHWFGESLADREDRGFGQYNAMARDWDDLCYAAPYFLPVWAAGNDRDDPLPGTGTLFYYYVGTGPKPQQGWYSKPYDPASDPLADGAKDGGYNTVGFQNVSKNILSVGAVDDAVSGGVRSLAAAAMTGFSCWGPTDDGRIKPDVVANGVSVYSALADSDSQYGSMSGTSMAAPNAAGSALLLLDLYRSLCGGALRAATLRGLILHTADDLGTAGPDYRFGWGLMNTLAAAEQIRRHAGAPAALHIVEDALTPAAPARHYAVRWNGIDPLRVTLCWTDPPGAAQSGLNVTNAALVNDLDLRVAAPGGGVHYPYVLDPADPSVAAAAGDNVRDNVEQVYLAAPASGVYEVSVLHKGTLTNAPQAFSLLLSGHEPAAAGTVLRFW